MILNMLVLMRGKAGEGGGVAEVRFVISAVHTVLALCPFTALLSLSFKSYPVGSERPAFRSVILHQETLIALS
jgi:hypothetical protein